MTKYKELIQPKWNNEEFSDDSLGISFEGLDDPEFDEIKEILKGNGNYSIDPRLWANIDSSDFFIKYFKSRKIFNPSHFFKTVFGLENRPSNRSVYLAEAYHGKFMEKLFLNYSLQGRLNYRTEAAKTKPTKI